MDYRFVGTSDLKVSAISLGTATFGGGGDFYKAWGETDVEQARRLVDIALDAGVTLFDTADVYSKGLSEEILGQTVQGRRDRMLIATKAGFRMTDAPDDVGATRKHLVQACDDSLRRLGVETIDLWQLHGFDMLTPLEETLNAVDELVRAGKVRYVGCSNYSGWQLMKAMALAGVHGWPKYVAHQVYYSLLARDVEWELLPLGLDQGVGTIVWSPLSAGMLSGKIGRNQPAPAGSRIASLGSRAIVMPQEQFFDLIDLLHSLAHAHARPVSQIALNWLLRRPTVCSLVIGARNEAQLRENLSASDFVLSAEDVARLDEASARDAAYPYWHQRSVYKERNPRLC
ncbi:aldo/keto reductase [Variovorax sp. KK3]|uniref:aldo/keto reductase n=1 Tax=Variovorax sp. KK3 TaxID=1855728 RepID=UPI00097C5F00|nr:aldo/keto reductase [Variovorax sp. KK3]